MHQFQQHQKAHQLGGEGGKRNAAMPIQISWHLNFDLIFKLNDNVTGTILTLVDFRLSPHQNSAMTMTHAPNLGKYRRSIALFKRLLIFQTVH